MQYKCALFIVDQDKEKVHPLPATKPSPPITNGSTTILTNVRVTTDITTSSVEPQSIFHQLFAMLKANKKWAAIVLGTLVSMVINVAFVITLAVELPCDDCN